MSTPDKNLDYEENTSVADVHASVRREKEDPQTGLEPATISVFAACAVFLMIGGAYLGANGGFNTSSVIPGYTPEAPEGAVAGGVKDPREEWLKDGKKAFGQCAACHGGNGLGMSADFPPLAGSEWVTGGTERLAALILHGLTGPITVKGKGYSGTQAMPAHKDTNSSEQVAQVISYIRNTWGNEASIVTAEMVDAAREKYAAQAVPFTEATLPAPDADLPGALPEWAGGAPAADAAPAAVEGSEEAPPAPAE